MKISNALRMQGVACLKAFVDIDFQFVAYQSSQNPSAESFSFVGDQPMYNFSRGSR